MIRFGPRYFYILLKQKFGTQKLRRQPEMDLVMLDEEQDREYARDGEEGSLTVLYDFIVHSITRVAPAQGQALDISSGSGQLLSKLAKSIPQMNFLGTDISDHMLEFARKSTITYGAANVSLIRQNMYELEKLQPRKFDLITWSLALHHCNRSQDVLRVLEGVHSLLKPGGTLFLFDIIRPKTGAIAVAFADLYNQRQGSWYYQDSLDSYKAAYSFEELGNILAQSRFPNIKHVQPSLGNFFQVAYVSSTHRRGVRLAFHIKRLWQIMDYWLMRIGFAGKIR